MKCPHCRKSLWFIESFCPFCKTPFNEEGRRHLERKCAVKSIHHMVANSEPTKPVPTDAGPESLIDVELSPATKAEPSTPPTPPRPQDGMSFCRNCGKEVNRQAIACPGCGVPPGIERNFCPGCGASTKNVQKECGSCGLFLTDTSRALVVASVITCLLLLAAGVFKFLSNPPRRSDGTVSIEARSPSPSPDRETLAGGGWAPAESPGLGHSQSWQQGYEEGKDQGKGNTIHWWFSAPAPFVPTPSELQELARRFAVFKKVAEANRADYQEGFYQGYRDGYQQAQKPVF